MEKQMKTWKSVAITAICLLLIVSLLYSLGVGWKQSPAVSEAPAGVGSLSLWNDGTGARD